jgi:hypothetical protein
MKTKPLHWIVISTFGLTAGWLCVKPAAPRKKLHVQRIHSVNSVYTISGPATPSTPAK